MTDVNSFTSSKNDRGQVLLVRLLRARYDILGTALIFASISCGLHLLKPRSFSASAIFAPSASTNGTRLGGIAAVGAQFGLNIPGGENSQSPAFYAELLKSRGFLSEASARRYSASTRDATNSSDLATIFDVKASSPALVREFTIRALQERLSVTPNTKTGTVVISASAPNAFVSRQLVEAALEYVEEYNRSRLRNQAREESRFLRQRLEQVGIELAADEQRLTQFLTSNRSTLSAAITMQEQRIRRAVAAKQTVYSALLQAYEQSRIEEVRTTPVITVVDPPETPVIPNSRGVLRGTIAFLFIGAIFGVFVGVLRQFNSKGSDMLDSVVIQEEVREEINLLLHEARHPLKSLARLLRLRGQQ